MKSICLGLNVLKHKQQQAITWTNDDLSSVKFSGTKYFIPQLIWNFALTDNYNSLLRYDNKCKYIFILLQNRSAQCGLISCILLSFQFQFVNSFLSLFYIAFYLQDMDRLKEVSQMIKWGPCSNMLSILQFTEKNRQQFSIYTQLAR